MPGVIINDPIVAPAPPGGVIVNDQPGGDPATDPLPPSGRFVLGAVVHFEETSKRDQGRTLDFDQRMTRTFEIYTSEPLVGSTTVAAFDQLVTPFPLGVPGSEWNGKPQRRVPRPGDKYVELNANWNVVHTNDHVVCADVQVDQSDRDDPQKWVVTCEYVGVADPVAQPAEVDWDTVPYQEAILVEPDDVPYLSRPILNSAKDPFAEGVMVDKDRYTLTVTKNVVRFDPFAAAGYQNTLNKVTAFAAQHPPGFPPGTCKLKLKAKRVRRSGNTDFYWRVTAVVEIDLLGWDARVRDAGFNYIDPGSGEKKMLREHPRFAAWGGPTTPSLLKPNGDWANPSDPIPAPLVFRRYVRKGWADLAPVLNY